MNDNTKLVPLDKVLEIMTSEHERLNREAFGQERAGNITAAACLAVCAHEVEVLQQTVQDVFSEMRTLS